MGSGRTVGARSVVRRDRRAAPRTALDVITCVERLAVGQLLLEILRFAGVASA